MDDKTRQRIDELVADWPALTEETKREPSVLLAQDQRVIEWGVRHEGHVTVCENEEAAQAFQAASGGEIVSRVTYSLSW